MSLVRVVTEGGPGAIVLFLYFYLSGLLLGLDVTPGVNIAIFVTVAFVFPLIIELASDWAIKFVALPIIVSAKKEIDENIDSEEDFYYDYEENQEELTKYDNQAFRYTVLLYAGALISISLPLVGYLYNGLFGILLALLGSALVFLTLVYLSYIKLRKIIQTSVRLYK